MRKRHKRKVSRHAHVERISLQSRNDVATAYHRLRFVRRASRHTEFSQCQMTKFRLPAWDSQQDRIPRRRRELPQPAATPAKPAVAAPEARPTPPTEEYEAPPPRRTRDQQRRTALAARAQAAPAGGVGEGVAPAGGQPGVAERPEYERGRSDRSRGRRDVDGNHFDGPPSGRRRGRSPRARSTAGQRRAAGTGAPDRRRGEAAHQRAVGEADHRAARNGGGTGLQPGNAGVDEEAGADLHHPQAAHRAQWRDLRARRPGDSARRLRVSALAQLQLPAGPRTTSTYRRRRYACST